MRARDVALVLTASWLTAQEPGAVFRATVDLVQAEGEGPGVQVKVEAV